MCERCIRLTTELANPHIFRPGLGKLGSTQGTTVVGLRMNSPKQWREYIVALKKKEDTHKLKTVNPFLNDLNHSGGSTLEAYITARPNVLRRLADPISNLRKGIKAMPAMKRNPVIIRFLNIIAKTYESHTKQILDNILIPLVTTPIKYCVGCKLWGSHAVKYVLTGPNNREEFCTPCRVAKRVIQSAYYGGLIVSENTVDAISYNNQAIIVFADDPNFLLDSGVLYHKDHSRHVGVIGNYHQHKGAFRTRDLTSTYICGVELEVEPIKANESLSIAKELHKILNSGKDVGYRCFFERDSSLAQGGFEIITQPMGLKKHLDMWKSLQKDAIWKKLTSHKSGRCGLHIHLGKSALTKLQIAKIMLFVNNLKNEPLIKAVARRYNANFCYIKEKRVRDWSRRGDHYDAVNIGTHTVEFRIFRGTLLYTGVAAALEFVFALAHYFAPGSYSGMKLDYQSFLRWLLKPEQLKETANLRAYLLDRLPEFKALVKSKTVAPVEEDI